MGDCIDCGYCVQVCPVGIDIRKGLQYQCISCALCVDACDTIMDNLKWPRGLVLYTSENALNGKKTRLVKTQVHRLRGDPDGGDQPADLERAHSRTLHRHGGADLPAAVHPDVGRGIRNSYEIKLNNKLTAPMTVGIRIEGLAGATLNMDGMERIELDPQERTKLLARVQIPPVGETARPVTR